MTSSPRKPQKPLVTSRPRQPEQQLQELLCSAGCLRALTRNNVLKLTYKKTKTSIPVSAGDVFKLARGWERPAHRHRQGGDAVIEVESTLPSLSGGVWGEKLPGKTAEHYLRARNSTRAISSGLPGAL